MLMRYPIRLSLTVVMLVLTVSVIGFRLQESASTLHSIQAEPVAIPGYGWINAVTATDTQIVVAGSAGLRVYDDLSQSPRLLDGHTAPVTDVVWYAPDNLLISGSWDNTVRLWNPDDGQTGVLRGHTGDVNAVAISPDGERVVSGSVDKTARIWDRETGETLHVLDRHENILEAVAISPDGETLATGGRDGDIHLWAMETGAYLASLRGHGDHVTTLMWQSDTILESGGRDGQHLRWNLDNDSMQVVAADRILTALVLQAATGVQAIAATDSDSRHSLALIYPDSETPQVQTYESRVTGVAFVPGKEQVVVATDAGDLRLLDSQTGEMLVSAGSGHSGAVNAIAFSPDGTRLISGGGNIFSSDNAVRVWDLETQRIRTVIDAHSGYVMSLAAAPDGERLAAGTDDGQVYVYPMSGGEAMRVFDGHEGSVLSLAFAADGRSLVSGGLDTTIQVHDLSSGETIAVMESPGGPVRNLLLDIDTRISGSSELDDTLAAYTVTSDTGEGLELLCSHGDDIEGSSFSPDRRLRASSNFDNVIELTTVEHNIRVHDLAGHSGWVTDTVFSPDSRMLASGSYDRTVRLWSVRTGEMLAVLDGPLRPITQVMFSPDGSLLAAASEDGTVRLWSLTIE